jgi:transcriptional regulator with XRE-family HTH domain
VPVDERSIGIRLQAIRKHRGLTQVEIAEKLGISQSLVSDYERGELRLHGALVAGFAKALNVSADEVLGLKPIESKHTQNGRLLRRLRRIEELPASDQKAVLKFLEALLEKRERARNRR